MKHGHLIISALVFALTVSGQVQRPSRDKAPGAIIAEIVSATFSDTDRRAIKEWVQGLAPANLPLGLAKRGELPPDLQKHLQKNGTLPSSLQKQISPFPPDLTKRLDPLPAGCGCARVFLDGKALITVGATNAILDAISLF